MALRTCRGATQHKRCQQAPGGDPDTALRRRATRVMGSRVEPPRKRPGSLLGECEVLDPGHVERRLLLLLRQPGDLLRDEIAEGEHADCTVGPARLALEALNQRIGEG